MKQFSLVGSLFILLLLGTDVIYEAKTPKRLPGINLDSITCQAMNESYCRFKVCSTEPIGPQANAYNIHLEVMQMIRDASIRIKLTKKVNNRYQPYLYDDQIDVCEFIQVSKRHIFWGLVMRAIIRYSNLNHTCPYNHDIILKNFSISTYGRRVPIPQGYYAVEAFVRTDNVLRVIVAAYFSAK